MAYFCKKLLQIVAISDRITSVVGKDPQMS